MRPQRSRPGGTLGNLELSNVLAVFERAEKECRFFPQVAELREQAGALTTQGQLMEIEAAHRRAIAAAASLCDTLA